MVKNKFILRNVIATVICLTVSATLFAQERTIQVMKGGIAVYTYTLSGNEKIVFKDPFGGTTPASDDVLIVNTKSGKSVETLLDEIKELTLSDNKLSVIPFSGTTAVYFDDVYLTFGKEETGINTPKAPEMDVKAWHNQSGEIVVECAAGILSLSLFTVEGKMIAYKKCDGDGTTTTVETRHATSLPTGIYLIRVESPQGKTVKQLIINN